MQGNQFKRDINRAIVIPGNWKLHWGWPVLLKYITAPAVSLVLSFAYPKFYNNNFNRDPPYLYSFILMHMVLLFIFGCFMFPPFLEFLIPVTRRGEGRYDVMPRIVIVEPGYNDEAHIAGSSDSGNEHKISNEPRDTKAIHEM